MKSKAITPIVILLAAALTSTSALAAKKKAAPEVPLTDAGKKLEAQYAAQLETLKAELSKALPAVNEQKKSAFSKAREAEVAAVAQLKAAKDDMGKINTGHALVAHAKGKWIGGADKGIAGAKAKLAKATTDAEKKAAQEELAKWQKNREDGVAALKERQANLDKALLEKPAMEKALNDAKQALDMAKAATQQAVLDLGLSATLSSDKLDAKLAKAFVIQHATPRGLAEFAQQGKPQQDLIGKLLFADSLLVQMAAANGAKDGNYGCAAEIYSAIRKASNKSGEDPLHRLAIAISLEHATPISQRNAVAKTNAPEFVDPVNRYLHYEKAFLDGELDPAFKDLSAWDLRMVVNGNEPDEILAWGREMLRNYRPDHITMSDYRWRYVALVRSDIRYGSQDNKHDRDDLQFFQNILKNGGICGRRAFIGRFILRAFGIPTTARPQKGHAALAHWTPDGWVVCLGAGWGSGWVDGRKSDLDFLEKTQARMAGAPFMQVKRAQWIGNLMGETEAYGLRSDNPEFWHAVSFYTQKRIIEEAEAKTLAAVGEDIGEANVTKEKVEITKVDIKEEDLKISVDSNGVITIPAIATSKPTKSTGKIIFMDSFGGGKQLHYGRTGGAQQFEYTFDAPAAGKYMLSAQVVTPSWQQSLMVTANDGKAAELELPHTVGMWEETKPLPVELVKGKNVLRFAHKAHGYEKGFSIKEFTLAPAG